MARQQKYYLWALVLALFLLHCMPVEAHSGCPYLIGSVAVGVIFPESIAGIEDWTPDEQDQMLDEVNSALAWWSARAEESGANVSWVVESVTLPTVYEPIERPHSDYELWIPDLLQLEGDWREQAIAYRDDLQARWGTDWAFIIFIVDSSKDTDGKFADGWFSFARMGGPFLVVTYDCFFYGPDRVDRCLAHEIGHIFCALDQAWCSHQACEYTAGYLDIENQNSEYGDCLLDDPSIMKHVTEEVWLGGLVDRYARGQLGWWDGDCDGVLDPVDDFIDPEGCPVYRVWLPIITNIGTVN